MPIPSAAHCTHHPPGVIRSMTNRKARMSGALTRKRENSSGCNSSSDSPVSDGACRRYVPRISSPPKGRGSPMYRAKSAASTLPPETMASAPARVPPARAPRRPSPRRSARPPDALRGTATAPPPRSRLVDGDDLVDEGLDVRERQVAWAQRQQAVGDAGGARQRDRVAGGKRRRHSRRARRLDADDAHAAAHLLDRRRDAGDLTAAAHRHEDRRQPAGTARGSRARSCRRRR